MRERPELNLSKSALASVDPAVWHMWQEYIRLTDAEIMRTQRRSVNLLVGSIAAALCVGSGVGVAATLLLLRLL